MGCASSAFARKKTPELGEEASDTEYCQGNTENVEPETGNCSPQKDGRAARSSLSVGAVQVEKSAAFSSDEQGRSAGLPADLLDAADHRAHFACVHSNPGKDGALKDNPQKPSLKPSLSGVGSSSASFGGSLRGPLIQLLTEVDKTPTSDGCVPLLTPDRLELVKEAMRCCRAFSALRPEDMSLLADHFDVVPASGGQHIVRAGDPPTAMFVVDKGRLAAAAPGHRGPAVLLPRGSLVGGAELAEARPHETDVSAQGVATLLRLTDAKASRALRAELSDFVAARREERRSAPPGSAGGVDIRELAAVAIVGKGMSATVRLLAHPRSGEFYALKTVERPPRVRPRDAERLRAERQAMAEASGCRFCATLVGAYQDERSLHLLQEYFPGGPLIRQLDDRGPLSEDAARFYAASILLALDHLHQKGVVYRDLKPDNLLLDSRGYLHLVDFGLAKKLDDTGRAYTSCGTPDYQSPEMVQHKAHGPATDYWSLGVVLHEMLTSVPPFHTFSSDVWDTYCAIVSGEYYLPDSVSEEGADLIRGLLQTDPDKRLGCLNGRTRADDVKLHAWFEGFDFEALEQGILEAPAIPNIAGPGDASNYDKFFEEPEDDVVFQVASQFSDSIFPWDEWEWVDNLDLQAK